MSKTSKTGFLTGGSAPSVLNLSTCRCRITRPYYYSARTARSSRRHIKVFHSSQRSLSSYCILLLFNFRSHQMACVRSRLFSANVEMII